MSEERSILVLKIIITAFFSSFQNSNLPAFKVTKTSLSDTETVLQ